MELGYVSSYDISATMRENVIGCMSKTFLHRQCIPIKLLVINTHDKAVQFSCCCSLDQRILFTALGMIHANATQAPNKWNCRSVTVATATPIDTSVNANTCIVSNCMVNIHINLKLHSIKCARIAYYLC
jgi:hypothetical protein